MLSGLLLLRFAQLTEGCLFFFCFVGVILCCSHKAGSVSPSSSREWVINADLLDRPASPPLSRGIVQRFKYCNGNFHLVPCYKVARQYHTERPKKPGNMIVLLPITFCTSRKFLDSESWFMIHAILRSWHMNAYLLDGRASPPSSRIVNCSRIVIWICGSEKLEGIGSPTAN